MRIEDFPRPPDDNGRGLHWSARLYHDAVHPSLDYWIEQLVAMKIKWLKLLDDGGGSGLVLSQKLMAAGIMPIVRLFMPQLNPSYLTSRELDTVSRYVDQGIRYFESNNEPDLPAEWQNNSRPSNWLEIVVNNFIRDADGVLGRGGLLALPAMGPGSRDNPLELVVQKGRIDLFQRGCWVAIHNYTLNHPLDFPYDEVNQQGRPLTQEEFDDYARWQYSHLSLEQIQAQGIPLSADDYGKFNRWAWDGRSLEMVNQVRASNKNPGQTAVQSPNCFNGYLAAGQMISDALGFYVPVISTEGGAVVGWGDDNRYAKVSPTTQMEMQVDIVRYMQSQAPPWYFAMCTWLLASRPLGDFNPTWEQMSWFTGAWDLQFGLSGKLPVIQALIDEPSVVRPELQAGRGVIQGVARRADGAPIAGLALRLLGANRDLAASSDAAGAFRFERLSAGAYDLHSGDQLLQGGIVLASDDATQSVELLINEGRQSSLAGLVSDTAGRPQVGAMVRLGSGEQHLAVQPTGPDGRYRFDGLAAGSYWISTADGSAASAGLRLDGWGSLTANLTLPAPAGYRYVVATQRLLTREETGNDRKFFGRVLDESGNGLDGSVVEMAWTGAAPGTQFPRVTTPRDPFKPAGNFEFLHSPGVFVLRVVEASWPSDETSSLPTSNVPGREGDPISYEVNFQRRGGGAAAGTASLRGAVTNGGGLGLTLWQGEPEQVGQPGQRSWALVLPASGAYAFDSLPAGAYSLALEGEGVVNAFSLADGAAATFNYVVGVAPVAGDLAGVVQSHDGQAAAGRLVQLWQNQALLTETPSDAAGGFRFAGLVAGRYGLAVAGASMPMQPATVTAGQTTTLTLSLPVETPQAKPLGSYWLLGRSPQGAALLGLLLPHLRAAGLTAGASLEEAMQAAQVTIVGGEEVVSPAEEQALAAAGCQVQRLPGDPFALAEALQL
jgi:hypothetical protein